MVGLLFAGAFLYLARLVYKNFTSSSCESGCGKCSNLDVDAIVRSAERKAKPTR